VFKNRLTIAYTVPTFYDMKATRNGTKKQIESVKVGSVAVKIYERHRKTVTGGTRTVWEVADYSQGVRQMLGFNDHGKARSEAKRIATTISTGNAAGADITNREAASFGRALELLRPTGLSLELAAATVAKCCEILGGDYLIDAAKHYARHKPDQITSRTVAEVISELVTLKTSRQMSVGYLTDLRLRLTRFADCYAVNISTVTTSDVQRFLDSLKLSTQSVRNYRSVLHTLFEFAEARGYILKGGNPVVGTESVKVNGGAIQIFTPDEITKLLKAASPDFLPLVAIGAFAGLRAAEAARIEWCDIDLEGGFITVAADKAKTKARRLVPIQTNLSQWLALYADHTGKVWPDGHDLQSAREACVKASSVPWKPNALRHSFASYRLAQIQNAAQVALEMGNSPNMVFKHYRELVKPAAAAQWFSVTPTTAAKGN